MLAVGSLRLSMRFANSEHVEVNAGTTSLGFRLDFHRSYEDQFAPSDSVIIGGEVIYFAA
jgi:hypothetical protein